MNAKFTSSALLLALTAILAGCGNKDNAQSAANDTPKPSASEVSESDLAASQEVAINNGANPESLDPHKVSGVPESNIIRQMLVGLTTTDNDGNTVGGMATEWSSPDNKVWTFKLRDAKWSNGDAVTADDFVFSMRRVVDPATASPYASYLADAKVMNAQDIVDGKAAPDTLGVKAIDEKTLEITLSEPVPYLPDVLIHTAAKPVNPKAVKEHGDAWTQAANYVVNGPYKLNQWQINEKIVLDRNTAYYDDANTTINKITLLPISDGATEVARYKAGELDVTSTIPHEQFTQLKSELGNQVSVAPQLCTYYYEVNHTKPPFNDARVRRALALTLDRQTIVDSILKQGQKQAYQMTPVATQGVAGHEFEPEWKAWDKAKRTEEAKKLLAEAGYNAQNPLKFDLLYNTSEAHKQLAVAATSFWQTALGADTVTVNLNNQEWKTYLETKRLGNFEMARAGWCSDYNEASTFLNIFKSGNSNNYGKYSSQAFDKLMLDSLNPSLDGAGRNDVYRMAEAQLDKDTAAILAYQYITAKLVKPYVVGISNTDPQDNYQVKNWKILKH